MTNKSESKAFLEPGTFHFVKWKNDIRKAEILERRICEDSSNDFIYYVHYEGFDRRLDEWITPERFVRAVVTSSSGATPAKRAGVDEEATDEGEASYQSRFPKKRKLNDGGSVKGPKKEDALEKEHEKNTKVRNIGAVVFGQYEVDTWYYSPFPDEYKCLEKVYFCERCMKYMKMKETWGRHMSLCDHKCPPGGLVYESGRNKIYEIDGKLNKLYCQNLCLLAKFFIDHKTIYYDVEGFVFYILTENVENEEHVVGYFSKEKVSYDNNNLACILVFPPYQRRGHSQLLIEFSYELSKKEGKIGSPEKPISDLGMKGYRSYWNKAILRLLKNCKGADVGIGIGSVSESSPFSVTPSEADKINTEDHEDTLQKKDEIITISINKISEMTGIRQDDVIETFRELGFLKYRNPLPFIETTATSAVAIHPINNVVNGDHRHEPYHQIHNHNSHKNQQHKLHHDEEYTQKRNQNRFVCITRRMVDDYIRSHGIRLENRVFDVRGLKWIPDGSR